MSEYDPTDFRPWAIDNLLSMASAMEEELKALDIPGAVVHLARLQEAIRTALDGKVQQLELFQ